MLKHLRTLTAASLLTTGLTAGTVTAAVVTAPAAHAVCADVGDTYYSTPNRGGQVWIPTSTYSDWKRGGTITRTESDGSSTAKTSGSSHSVGADLKVGGKIGPVGVDVTVKYNYTWNKSTTTTTSVTRGWSYAFDVPSDSVYRARAYKLGWKFRYVRTRIVVGPGGSCKAEKTQLWAFVPVKKNKGTYYWALEKRANKGNYRYDGL